MTYTDHLLARPLNSHIKGCYCVCHSVLSSCPVCEHCTSDEYQQRLRDNLLDTHLHTYCADYCLRCGKPDTWLEDDNEQLPAPPMDHDTDRWRACIPALHRCALIRPAALATLNSRHRPLLTTAYRWVVVIGPRGPSSSLRSIPLHHQSRTQDQ